MVSFQFRQAHQNLRIQLTAPEEFLRLIDKAKNQSRIFENIGRSVENPWKSVENWSQTDPGGHPAAF